MWKKTIRPETSMGGIAGGIKFVVRNILFKVAIDEHGIWNYDDEAAAKGMYFIEAREATDLDPETEGSR